MSPPARVVSGPEVPRPARLPTSRRACAALLVLLSVALPIALQSAETSLPALTALETEVRRVAAPGIGSGGTVGVAAWRLDGRGPRLSVNAHEPFPMASTLKIALACTVLRQIEEGKLRLDQLIPIEPAMLVESDVIAERLIHPGVILSIYNLLELSLTYSDNTATDALMAAVGGPQAVTTWLRSQGVEGQRVDRNTAWILRDFFDLPPGEFSLSLAAARHTDLKFDERGSAPNAAFDHDLRDTSTPESMALLLTRLFNARALGANSSELITSMMERNHTGDRRLRALLPQGTLVADKTGTLGGTVNDVGVVTLPDGAGKVVIAVFIKGSDAPLERRERSIAEIGRVVRDYYLLAAPKTNRACC